MKKLISGIMAIAILASAVLCGTTTAFAADTGNSAVGDVEMWNCLLYTSDAADEL